MNTIYLDIHNLNITDDDLNSYFHLPVDYQDKIQLTKRRTRSTDPAVIAAIIQGSATILVALITAISAYLKEKDEKEKKEMKITNTINNTTLIINLEINKRELEQKILQFLDDETEFLDLTFS